MSKPQFGHVGVECERMQSFVIGLSGQRPYRDLFWQLATLAPVLLVVLLVLVAIPRCRRAAIMGLVLCAGGAVLGVVMFHYAYALAIWRRHDSAIRYLDQSAVRAGFAAGAVTYAAGLAVYATVRRVGLRVDR
jgi:hypothetical protein